MVTKKSKTEKSGEYDYMDLFVFPGKMQKREIT